MGSEGVRERLRKPATEPSKEATSPGKLTASTKDGQKKPSVFAQGLRITLFVSWFLCCCTSIFATQLLGSWLYFVNKDYYYAYMALTKQSFGILCAVGTQWFSPTRVRVSGDKSVTDQLKLTKDGRLETNFPERLVMIANHQLYPEWAYLWWVAYTSRMHGHMYIILKESLKYLPILGQGMMFYGFIFMARNWGKDQKRMEHRLRKLNSRHSGPLSGSHSLDPMWLLIFPEGTNLSQNTRKGSAKWAEKSGIEDFRHQLLPRITGLQYALSKLQNSVDWVYDCTLGYEDVPDNEYAEQFYTLHSTYLHGRPPRVNMYFRRFAVSSIPVDDPKAFEEWLMKVWREKEALLNSFVLHGRFPASDDAIMDSSSTGDLGTKSTSSNGYIETEIKLAHWMEVGQIFVVLAALALVANVAVKALNIVTKGAFA